MSPSDIQWALSNPKKFIAKYALPTRWGILLRKMITPLQGFQQRVKTPYEEFQDICVNQLPVLRRELLAGRHYPRQSATRKVSILVETRTLPQNEFVITNTVTQLGEGWDHIIYCSSNNHQSLQSIARTLSASIIFKIIPESFSRNDYNELLLSSEFWNELDYDWVLIYQTDTYVFEPLRKQFFKFDYTGAPWSDEALPFIAAGIGSKEVVPVGNGGLSLRNVRHMQKLLKLPEFEMVRTKNDLDPSLESAPEDVVVSYLTQRYGVIAPVTSARQFATEHATIPEGYVFGCHQPYLPSPHNQVLNSFKERINGINVAGFVNNILGLGQNARNVVAGLQQVNRPLFVNEMVTAHARQESVATTNNHSYVKNLVCCNPDYDYYTVLGDDYFQGKKNAALWAWELERVPSWWRPHADRFEVLFTISNFCKQVLEKEFPNKQVVTLPLPGIRFQKRDTVVAKQHFNITKESQVYLFMFDGGSDFYRKNPDAVIRAFKDAFPMAGNERLIIKCHRIKPKWLAVLKKLADGDRRITLLNRPLKHVELELLLNACDVYVSLHRSEGFGLTLLEALSLGKPVVCTNWSGNTDFCKPEWSLLVDYTMIPVQSDSDYHDRVKDLGEVCYWADPVHDDAVRQLKLVSEQYGHYQSRAQKAARWVHAEYYDLTKTAALINEYL